MDVQDFVNSLLAYCLLTVQVTAAKRDALLYCGACQAMVEEIQYGIEEIDPTKTIEMGFRIDPNGHQKVKKIPYAGSEVHLMELFEDVCSKLRDYAESTDPETNVKKYVRFNARKEGEPVELKNVSINKDISKSLEIACQNIIDEYEDDIVDAFTSKQRDTKTGICNDIVGVCSEPTEAEDETPEKTEL